ncbi:MAG: helix-hairpin-helix domain-containing protein [Acidimicrobiia bacterium]
MSPEPGSLDGLVARLEPRRLISAAITVIVVAAAGWWLVRPPSTPIDATLAVATTSATRAGRGAPTSPPGSGPDAGGSAGVDDGETIVVHAAGAVVLPGVYKMPSGARVSDLITAAGGPTIDGDPNALNLAGELRDGDRIEVPRIGQAPIGVGASASGASGGQSPRIVNLNRGSAEELDALPGVGPATAAAIVSYREQHGPFGSVDGLLDVPGIGPAKLEAIREFVDV